MTAKSHSETRQLVAYFVLVGILTLPFWVGGSLLPVRLMPGLSVAALAIVVPLISAAVVTAKMGGAKSLGSLFASVGRLGAHPLAIALIAVAVPLLVAMASWMVSGQFNKNPAISASSLFALVPVFVLAAMAEEVGWSAFATERLLNRTGTLLTGLIVGALWAIWHWPALIDLGRAPDWIGWWSLWTVMQRVIMVQLYQRGRSWIWGPIVFHAASNVAWQVAPDAFDPRIEGVSMAAIAALFALTAVKRDSAMT